MATLFLILPLLSAACYVALDKHFDIAYKLSTAIHIALIGTALYTVANFAPTTIINFTFSSLSQIHLNLVFALDKLSLCMLLLISLISFVVNIYAASYVYSDLNRSRFLFQLSLVTFSVIFLVLSANLLTAFIGWQLIGFHLYWLLNHYHYDENANRAAKKKFVINRVGDISFLLAVIISLYFYSSTDFEKLFNAASPTVSIFEYSISVRTLILSCVFIAVMTKSAQFPFHIWLPDTMQTPTPVSAMMHAGVINAGGYLLAKLSPGLITTPSLLIFISCIGVITLLLGNLFALSQPDIKKQLAYSTMSQMGYMVLQCGLGCFAGAVFHLIAHGFFKAWSFLNSGNQLAASYDDKKNNIFLNILSLISTLIILVIALYLSDSFHQTFSDFPLLATFLAITLYQLIRNIVSQKINIPTKIISMMLLIGLFVNYFYLIFGYDSALQTTFPIVKTPLIIHFQYAAIASLAILYALYLYIKYNKPQSYVSAYTYYLFSHKLFIEEIYRSLLLKPMRDLGDIFYQFFVMKKMISLLILGLILLPTIIPHHHPTIFTAFLYVFDSTVLLIFLLIANRAQQLKHILLFLALSQFTLALLAFLVMSPNAIKISYFQLINTILLSFFMVMILYKIKYGKKMAHRVHNNLPWLATYLTAALFCLIGLPFTPTFMSEVIILKELITVNPLLVIVVLVAIVLFAISVLHTLQDYIFKASAIERLSIRLSNLEHVLLMGILLFNFLNGLYPSFILRLL